MTQKKLRKTHKTLTVLTLVAAITSLGIGGWISRAGGEVSHSEFRNDDAPPPASTQHHDEMNMSPTNGLQQHDSPAQLSDGNKVPDTIEGIWTELHRHQSELARAIGAKRLDEVHPHVLAINNLTEKLMEIVHPDHKAAVQEGTDKINRAANDLHQASDDGNQSAAEQSLKQLGDALNQLEEQMKKE